MGLDGVGQTRARCQEVKVSRAGHDDVTSRRGRQAGRKPERTQVTEVRSALDVTAGQRETNSWRRFGRTPLTPENGDFDDRQRGAADDSRRMRGSQESAERSGRLGEKTTGSTSAHTPTATTGPSPPYHPAAGCRSGQPEPQARSTRLRADKTLRERLASSLTIRSIARNS